MEIAVVFGRDSYRDNAAYRSMVSELEAAGHGVRECRDSGIPVGTDMLASVGGDGTFLRTARMAAPCGIPVVGVNLGHLGFLSENTPAAVSEALCSGRYHVQERTMLKAEAGGNEYLALNEICVSRGDGPMLGIRVSCDGTPLPVYWADGLLISTPSGSTAYSLSVGGPVVTPLSKVFVVAPVAPHNLNMRPMVVPQESRFSIEFVRRSGCVRLSADNISVSLAPGSPVEVGMAQFSLKRVCLDNTSFVKALSEKLLWGEDRRNER